MSGLVRPFDVPAGSEISRHLPGAHFQDCHAMPIAPDGGSALEIYLRMVAQTPRWVDRLMTLRNRLVRFVGLKDLGLMRPATPARDVPVGDRVGIFCVHHLSDDEVILGDSDRHRDVKVSVRRVHGDGRSAVAITTVVQVPNALGRAYMVIVAPIHRRIVPAILKALAHRGLQR